MVATKNSVNKSEIVREMLRTRKLLTDDAPKGWAKELEDEMQKKGLKIHQTTLYQIRRKEMGKLAKDQETRRAGRVARSEAKDVRESDESVTVSDCVKVVALLKELGGSNKSLGYAKLRSALKLLDVLGQ